MYRFPANSTLQTDKYVRGLPEGVTLTSHEPTISPWELLLSENSFPADAIDVAAYKTLIVNNETDGVVILEANEDSNNVIRFGPSTQSTLDNDPPKIGSLVVDSEGAGFCYIWGIR